MYVCMYFFFFGGGIYDIVTYYPVAMHFRSSLSVRKAITDAPGLATRVALDGIGSASVMKEGFKKIS